MIITIGREYGSGGHEIGRKLAEQYKLPFYDKEALVKLAKEKGVYDEIISFYEEKPVNSLLYAIAMNAYSENIGKAQFDLIRSITQNKSCVIIGRCGNYIFRDTPDTVSVFIHADLETRMRHVRDEYGVKDKNLKAIIEKTDKQRASFHKFYTEQEWGDARNYHLTINSGEIGVDSCVELISGFIEKKKGSQGVLIYGKQRV